MFGAIEPVTGVSWMILALAAAGAATDLACGRIFNWMTIPALLGGVVVSAWIGGWSGLGFSLLAVIAGLLLYGWMFLFGAMGAGDVKFLMALGAWGGLRFVFETALLGVVLGGIMAVVLLLFRGSLVDFAKRMRSFLLSLLIKELEIEKPRLDASSKMPFGIPIAAAAAWIAFGDPFSLLGVKLWSG